MTKFSVGEYIVFVQGGLSLAGTIKYIPFAPGFPYTVSSPSLLDDVYVDENDIRVPGTRSVNWWGLRDRVGVARSKPALPIKTAERKPIPTERKPIPTYDCEEAEASNIVQLIAGVWLVRTQAGFRRLSKFLVAQTEQRPYSYPKEYPSVVRLLSSGTYRDAVVKCTPLADEISNTSDYLELLKSQLRNN